MAGSGGVWRAAGLFGAVVLVAVAVAVVPRPVAALRAPAVPSDTLEVAATTGLDLPPHAAVLPGSALTMFTGYTTPPGGAHEDGTMPGSGNQTYLGGMGWGVTDRVTALFGMSMNDDPSYARIGGEFRSQYHVDVGLGLRLLATPPGTVAVGVQAAAEWIWMSSGPGLFNAGTETAKTRFPAFALDVPITFRPAPGVFATLLPSVAYLPRRVLGAPYFGTAVRLGARVDARVADAWTLWGSGEVPLGPGETSIDRNGNLTSMWTWRAGVRFHAAERVSLDGAVTNASGGTAATRHLTMLGAPVTLYTLKLRYAPTEPEALGPPQSMTVASGSVVLDGITVPAPATVPTAHARVTATRDAEGGGGLQVALGLGRRFHFELLTTRIRGPDVPAVMEAPIGTAYEYRFGPQVMMLDQSEGAPFSLAGRVTVGRDVDDQQGYLLAEAVAARRFGERVEVTLDPLVIESGGRSLASVGAGARVRVGPVEVLPEGRASFTGEDAVWALGLRLPAVGGIRPDVFVTNSGGTLGLGRVLADPAGARFGVTVRSLF